MNNELYEFICMAKINESIHTTTYIILEHQHTSYEQLQETFINVCSFIGTFISIKETCLWIDVLVDTYDFINDKDINIKKIYILITKLCIICDLNLKNDYPKTKNIPFKTLRTKIIDIFENVEMKLTDVGIEKIRDILPSPDNDYYSLSQQIILGYLNYTKNIIEKMNTEHNDIIKYVNKLRDSVDYITRKKITFENKIKPDDTDNIWFIWSIYLTLFDSSEIQLLFSIFNFEYTKKTKNNRIGLLYGGFLIIIYNMNKNLSRLWDTNEMIILKKIEDIGMELYIDIKNKKCNEYSKNIKYTPTTNNIEHGLDYLSNYRPILTNDINNNTNINNNNNHDIKKIKYKK